MDRRIVRTRKPVALALGAVLVVGGAGAGWLLTQPTQAPRNDPDPSARAALDRLLEHYESSPGHLVFGSLSASDRQMDFTVGLLPARDVYTQLIYRDGAAVGFVQQGARGEIIDERGQTSAQAPDTDLRPLIDLEQLLAAASATDWRTGSLPGTRQVEAEFDRMSLPLIGSVSTLIAEVDDPSGLPRRIELRSSDGSNVIMSFVAIEGAAASTVNPYDLLYGSVPTGE